MKCEQNIYIGSENSVLDVLYSGACVCSEASKQLEGRQECCSAVSLQIVLGPCTLLKETRTERGHIRL